jgi:hypothetical protein
MLRGRRCQPRHKQTIENSKPIASRRGAAAAGIVLDKTSGNKDPKDRRGASHSLIDAHCIWPVLVDHDFLVCRNGYDLESQLLVLFNFVQFGKGNTLTQPALAIPLKMFPAMMRYMVVAEPDIQDPTIPTAQPPTMNHFFPNRSLREP